MIKCKISIKDSSGKNYDSTINSFDKDVLKEEKRGYFYPVVAKQKL